MFKIMWGIVVQIIMVQIGIIDNYGQFYKEKVFYKIYKCIGEEM